MQVRRWTVAGPSTASGQEEMASVSTVPLGGASLDEYVCARVRGGGKSGEAARADLWAALQNHSDKLAARRRKAKPSKERPFSTFGFSSPDPVASGVPQSTLIRMYGDREGDAEFAAARQERRLQIWKTRVEKKVGVRRREKGGGRVGVEGGVGGGVGVGWRWVGERRVGG